MESWPPHAQLVLHELDKVLDIIPHEAALDLEEQVVAYLNQFNSWQGTLNFLHRYPRLELTMRWYERLHHLPLLMEGSHPLLVSMAEG